MTDKNYQITPDSKLWNTFLKGDEGAFNLIYKNHVRQLYRYGLNFSQDGNLVKDCIHDVFVDLYKYRSTLKETNNIQLYLFKALKNCILKSVSKRKRELGIEQVENSFLSEQSYEEVQIEKDSEQYRANLVHEALSTLSSRQKEALFLKFYSGLGYEEISGILNVNYQSARNLVHRSIEKLRESYSKNGIILFSFFNRPKYK
jgi:RNA polymerase sigma factor (sigma-70 family)